MISFLKANSWYIVKENLSNTQAKVFVFVGQKEQSNMIRSAHRLHEMIPDSILEIKKKMYHGDFSINYAKEYADTIIRILENKDK